MDFDQLARTLRAQSRDLNRQLRTELRAAGEIVAVAARAKAEEHSKKIAETIKVQTRTYGVRVSAGGPGVPEAALLEKGNVNSSPTATTFRHPLPNAPGKWVEQPKHPYLLPGFVETEPQVMGHVRSALQKSFPGGS